MNPERRMPEEQQNADNPYASPPEIAVTFASTTKTRDRFSRGRTFFFVAATIALGLSAFAIVAYLAQVGPGRLPAQVIRFALATFLFVEIYRGQNWARYLMIVFAAGGVLVVATSLFQIDFSETSLLAVCALAFYAICYGIVAAALLSSSVDVFASSQRQKFKKAQDALPRVNPNAFPCPECNYPLSKGAMVCPQCDWRHKDLDFS